MAELKCLELVQRTPLLGLMQQLLATPGDNLWQDQQPGGETHFTEALTDIYEQQGSD